ARRRAGCCRSSTGCPGPRAGGRPFRRHAGFRGGRGSGGRGGGGLGGGLHFFRIARRRHDGDQGRIGALHHAYVRGKRDVAQVLRVVDLEAGNVDVERFRNVVGGTLHFDGVGDDVDGAAALDPRRLLRIDHVDRDAHADARTLAEAKEIDVHRQILHRIELVIARDYALLAAVEIELVDRGEEAAGIDALLEI